MVRLAGSGAEADWSASQFQEGAWVLEIDGAEQSTVLPSSPTVVVYEYLQRVAHVLDQRLPSRAPTVLHLGGGGLTLPRRLEVTHPGAEQVVVDLDGDLMDFVLESFPLAHPDRCSMVIGDVREALPRTGFRAPYDAVVLDIALDQHSPARLFQAAFIEELSALTAPDGVVLINVGDDAGLPACRRLVRVCLGLGLSVFATAPADVLAGDYTGNVILALSRRPWDAETLAAVRSSGPQPAGLVTGEALRQLLT